MQDTHPDIRDYSVFAVCGRVVRLVVGGGGEWWW